MTVTKGFSIIVMNNSNTFYTSKNTLPFTKSVGISIFQIYFPTNPIMRCFFSIGINANVQKKNRIFAHKMEKKEISVVITPNND